VIIGFFLLDFKYIFLILEKMKIVECIPNISEGKDIEKIKAITEEAKNVEGAYLLDVYTGSSTNRSVLTLAGEPHSIKEVIFRIFKKTSELIDMSKHEGVHPRIGALDVCPFIPVSNITMKECVDIAEEVAQKVAVELGIPVYLYGESAKEEKRKDLANIRKGGYEGLKEKIKNPEWKPDFGKSEFNEKSGASVVGARDFLIAFNINLETKDNDLADKIARKIRKSVKLEGIKVIGWYIEELGCAQVSTNVIDYRATPLYILFEEVKKESGRLRLEVTGSELVGLVPEEALLETGKFYLSESLINREKSKQLIIGAAVSGLGLSDKYKFDPQKKILEYRIKKEML
jgi:glutamate formiminotransferase / formiminotetrahydrofolate cyclodeaminase